MSELRVSAAALRRSGESLSSDAEGADQQLHDALQAISGIGPCWGTDEAGQSFATAYLPAATELVLAARLATAQVHDLAERLAASAHDYETTEQDATARARRVDP